MTVSTKRKRSRAGRVRAYEPDRIIGEWWCPVCGRAAHRTARPGRPKVYCSNACRQRAYRARRSAGCAVFEPDPAPRTRARTRERSHALRPAADVAAGRVDVVGREITMCGTFARRATRPPWSHTRFVPDLQWSCRTCAALGP